MLNFEIIENINNDKRKLLLTLSYIKKGFYQSKGFYLATTINKEIRVKTLLIPPRTLNNLITNNTIKEIDEDFWLDNYHKEEIKLPEFISIFDTDLPTLRIDHNRINEALILISKIFQVSNLSIKIYPTVCGTICSFRRINNNLIYLYPRFDADEKDIIEAIIAMIIRSITSYSWEENQLLQKFFTDHTSISNIVRHSKTDTNHEIIDAVLTSDKNFIKIGYPNKSILSIENGNIIFNNKQLKSLTLSEKKLLSNFILKKEQLITFDEIAESIWSKPNEKFSLQAISKTIERLRKKLINEGINKTLIFTKKGEGYIFID